MWRSFSTCSTGFKEVSKVKEVNSQVVINEVTKTFISPYKAGCVSRANSLFASSRAHEKSMVELLLKNVPPQSEKSYIDISFLLFP